MEYCLSELPLRNRAKGVPVGGLISIPGGPELFFVSLAVLGALIPVARQTGHPVLYYLVISGVVGLFWQVAYFANYASQHPLREIIPQARRGVVMMQYHHGTAAAEHARTAVEIYFRETARPPAHRTEARLPADSSYAASEFVDSVNIVQGAVIITFSNEAVKELAGKSVAMIPYEDRENYPQQVLWRCGERTPVVGGRYALLGTAAGLPAIQANTTIDADLRSDCNLR